MKLKKFSRISKEKKLIPWIQRMLTILTLVKLKKFQNLKYLPK